MSESKKSIDSLNLEKVSAILLDVAGTTTAINYVKETLFPYVTKNAEEFLKSSWEEEEVKKAISQFEEKDLDVTKASEFVKALTEKNDNNVGLKAIQGLLFKKGYGNGDLKGHIFDDVPKCLESWSKSKKLAIFSTGSIDSQQLLFKNTIQGDLSSHISKYFDESVGVKTEADSYKKIAEELEVAPENILFLTDDIKEAESAKSANLKVALVEREGNAPIPEESLSTFAVVKSFSDIPLETVKRKIEDESVEGPPSKIAKTDATVDAEMTEKLSTEEVKETVEDVKAEEKKNEEKLEEAMDVDVQEEIASVKEKEEKTVEEEKEKTVEKAEEKTIDKADENTVDMAEEKTAEKVEEKTTEKVEEEAAKKSSVENVEEEPVEKKEDKLCDKEKSSVDEGSSKHVEPIAANSSTEDKPHVDAKPPTEEKLVPAAEEKPIPAKEEAPIPTTEEKPVPAIEEKVESMEVSEIAETEPKNTAAKSEEKMEEEPTVSQEKKEGKTEIEIGTQTKTVTNECETQTTISIKVAEELPVEKVQEKLMETENEKTEEILGTGTEKLEKEEKLESVKPEEMKKDTCDKIKEEKETKELVSEEPKEETVTKETNEEALTKVTEVEETNQKLDSKKECKLESTKAEDDVLKKDTNEVIEKVDELEEKKEIEQNKETDNKTEKDEVTEKGSMDITESVSKENGVAEEKSDETVEVVEEKENKSELANGKENGVTNGEASDSSNEPVDPKEDMKVKKIEDKVESTPVSVEA